ncbi:MAG: SIMPL domain-containing protein [Rhodomicrobium sp.]|nr:MAG: SIMPL domain-containing protein [Rhodomicrobium sp.]
MSQLIKALLLMTLALMFSVTSPLTGSLSEAVAETKRVITMTGRASVGAAPDKVEISLGVSSKAETARDALTLNTANMNNVLKTLKDNGIEEKFIQTSNFSIQPDYEHFRDGRAPKIRGYRVSNSVKVLVEEIDKVGALLDKVVSSGSNQINGIRFLVSKEDELKDEARKSAVAVATRKAKLYAEAAGVKLGDVIMITESSHGGGHPVPIARTLAKEANAVPIAGGEQQLSVSVTMSWELD